MEPIDFVKGEGADLFIYLFKYTTHKLDSSGDPEWCMSTIHGFHGSKYTHTEMDELDGDCMHAR